MIRFILKNKSLSILLTALMGVLGGCALSAPKHLMDVQPGEHFYLKQPITIPAGKTRQFIQFGELSGSHFNHSEPHCRIEIYELKAQDTVIQPQKFAISRVQLGEEEIALNRKSVQLAANEYGSYPSNQLVLAYDQQRPETMDLVHLYLKSESQPNVYRLTCAGALSDGNLMDAPRSYRPQRDKINQILGKIGTVDQ